MATKYWLTHSDTSLRYAVTEFDESFLATLVQSYDLNHRWNIINEFL